MYFQVTESHLKQYWQNGFVIFKNIIPEDLLKKLRVEADKGRTIARELKGPQVQRLQPVIKHPDIDISPFDELLRLPVLFTTLCDLFKEAFGEPIIPWATRTLFGILYEPAEMPWCMNWHRDYRDVIPGLDIDVWYQKTQDIRMFNQVNIALYEDPSLWVVPGSHARRDTPDEIRRFPDRPILPPDPKGKTAEEMRQICIEYVKSMPGAVNIILEPGDYLLYRSSLWHIGNYDPQTKRATIHDGIYSTPWKMYYLAPLRRDYNGFFTPMSNPNADTETYKQIQAERTRMAKSLV
jgi:hypothetical protein